jgi:hypothetical protein
VYIEQKQDQRQENEIQLGSAFDRIENDKFPAAFFNDVDTKEFCIEGKNKEQFFCSI